MEITVSGGQSVVADRANYIATEKPATHETTTRPLFNETSSTLSRREAVSSLAGA